MSYKVVFAGTPDFALNALKSLIQDKRFFVSTIITQEDKKVGREQILTQSPVKKIGIEHGIKVLQPLKKEEITEILKLEKPDFFIVVAYGKILPKESLEIAKFNINIHGSILPKYRGASPIQSAILNGETKTGISIMNIEEKMDAGNVWKILECEISNKDTSETIFDKLSELSKDLPNILEEIIDGKIKSIKQDESNATYCKKINKEDGKINWEAESTKQIFNKIRAFTPWPGVFTSYNGKVLKIIKASTVTTTSVIPGTYSIIPANFPVIPAKAGIFHGINNNSNFISNTKLNTNTGTILNQNGKILVQTIDGFLELIEIQLEGKKSMKIEEFIKGQKDFIGSKLI